LSCENEFGHAARQYLFRQKHRRSQGWIPAVVLRNLVVDILDVSGIAFVNGRSGNDTIVAPKFVDDLCGNSGNDTLIGGAGRDMMSTGADTFVFLSVADSPAGNGDVIRDFTSSQLNKIDLSAIDANSGTDANDAFSFISSSAFTDTAGELRFVNGVLMADLNGDQIADFEVTLNNVAVLNEPRPIREAIERPHNRQDIMHGQTSYRSVRTRSQGHAGTCRLRAPPSEW